MQMMMPNPPKTVSYILLRILQGQIWRMMTPDVNLEQSVIFSSGVEIIAPNEGVSRSTLGKACHPLSSSDPDYYSRIGWRNSDPSSRLFGWRNSSRTAGKRLISLECVSEAPPYTTTLYDEGRATHVW